jgi:hypothetical protein
MMDFKVWEDEGPPKGTNYNFPPRGDVVVNVVGYPAPVKIGTQMYAQSTILQDDRPLHASRKINGCSDGFR